MHSEDLLVDDGCNRQAVEAVCEGFPQLDVVPPFALVVEPIDTIDRGAFMVPTEDKEVFWILDLVCQEQADRLEGLLASIDIIAEEEVICFRWKTTVLEESEQIVVLAMNVSAYLFGVRNRAHNNRRYAKYGVSVP